MIAALASLFFLAQELPAVVAKELPTVPARPLPAGSELRLHEASALTGHDELLRAIAALRTPIGGTDAAAELARLAELHRVAQESAAGIVATMGARLALVDGQSLVHLGAGRLALLGLPEQHDRLAATLAGAVGFSGHIEVEARLYYTTQVELPASAFEQGLVLAEKEARELVQRLEDARRELVVAPKVLVRPWLETTLSSLEEVPYIKDYELTSVPGLDTEILDPVIEVLPLGVEIALRCTPSLGGRVGFLFDLSHRKLRSPLRDFATTLGKSPAPVTIQLADLRVTGFEGFFELGEGETLFLAAGPPEECVSVLVRARHVPEAR